MLLSLTDEEVLFDSYDGRVRVTNTIVTLDEKVHAISNLKSAEIDMKSGNIMVRNLLCLVTIITILIGCNSGSLASFWYFVSAALFIFIAIGTIKGTLLGNSKLRLIGRGGETIDLFAGESEYIGGVAQAINIAIEEYDYKNPQDKQLFSKKPPYQQSFPHPSHQASAPDKKSNFPYENKPPVGKITQKITEKNLPPGSSDNISLQHKNIPPDELKSDFLDQN